MMPHLVPREIDKPHLRVPARLILRFIGGKCASKAVTLPALAEFFRRGLLAPPREFGKVLAGAAGAVEGR